MAASVKCGGEGYMIFFCDCCHYTFSAESLPNRCPDCGKQQFSGAPAVREATGREIDEYKRVRIEIAAENKILKTP